MTQQGAGHSVQVVSLLVAAAGSFVAVPLSGRIHDGVKFTNRDHRTAHVKFGGLIDSLGIVEPYYLVADAAYACRTIARWLVSAGNHLITRLPRHAVAWVPAPALDGPRRRGRPKRYGAKVKLSTLFARPTEAWVKAPSPIYGERNVTIRILSLDLIWRPTRQLARFVWVDHPIHGRSMFITTKQRLKRVYIANPAVLDSYMASPNQVALPKK